MKNKYSMENDIVTIYIDSPKYGKFEALINERERGRLSKKYSFCFL